MSICTSGFVGLAGCGCRYCRLRCSILVAMRQHHVISYYFEVLVWHVCYCRVTDGVYVRCSVYFCSCGVVGGVVVGMHGVCFWYGFCWGVNLPS